MKLSILEKKVLSLIDGAPVDGFAQRMTGLSYKPTEVAATVDSIRKWGLVEVAQLTNKEVYCHTAKVTRDMLVLVEPDEKREMYPSGKNKGGRAL